jgi:CRISPR-associated protein Csd1
MIHRSVLRALVSYHERISDAVPRGFQKKEIPFVIVVDREGKFSGLEDTREMEGRKKTARSFNVPRREGMRASGISPNLLWDNPSYVVGKPKLDPTKDRDKQVNRASEQREAFVEALKEAFSGPSIDEGIEAVRLFLERGDYSGLVSHSDWKEVEEGGLNLSFRMKGDLGLVCERPAVIAKIVGSSHSNSSDSISTRTCLVTGEPDKPVRLHAPIKGVWDAQSSGANIISFNLSAFNSYGKVQGLNAPVGKKAEFAYTTALNSLLAKGSRHRFQVSNTSTVFWAANIHPVEEWMADLFGMPPDSQAKEDTDTIPTIYAAPRKGTAVSDKNDLTPFYILGLSPNASRLAIRFWHAGTVGEVVRNIETHFDDIKLVHGNNERDQLSLFRLLSSTALQGKSENITPNLAGDVMKAVLNGTPYPRTLLSAAIRRTRAEQKVTYPRAALIKAVLARTARYYGKSEKEVGMALNESNTNKGYLLGRLFAALERAQASASPGINATIRDRFYGGASSTPVAVFPHLMKLKNHHLAKIENVGARINIEKLIGRVVDGLDDFPAHLDLADQGRFAIGYYHQVQEFFRKKEVSGSEAFVAGESEPDSRT